MDSNFGTNAELKLDKINPILERELKRISLTLGDLFEFGKVGELKRTPEKGYHARADVEVRGKGYELQANMPIILFLPNNGTGNQEHNNLPYTDSAWTPRPKTGEAEAIFSIGTGYNDNWFSGLLSLAGVTINPQHTVNPIREYSRFTTHPTSFMSELLDGSKFDHHKMLRTGFTYDSHVKESNPHAIIFDERLKFDRLKDYHSLFQIAGFLHFPEKSQALDKLKRAHQKHLDTLIEKYDFHHR